MILDSELEIILTEVWANHIPWRIGKKQIESLIKKELLRCIGANKKISVMEEMWNSSEKVEVFYGSAEDIGYNQAKKEIRERVNDL